MCNGCGAYVFVRSVFELGNVQARLLTSKSHITRLTEIITLRLEVLGNLLVPSLISTAKTTLKKEIKF